MFLDGVYYYAMTVLAIALFVLQAAAFRLARQRSLEMAHLSNRLELELLKRHIQPHFLMNTLTALSEWIIESPSTGVKMIQELAQEFRILNDIAGKTLVPLSRELELCHAHIALMSYRNDRDLSLKTDLVDPEAQVPPAIFHTLIENALTHNRYKAGGTMVFGLTQTAGAEKQMTYIFTVPPGERVVRPESDTARKGLGVSYIRARLDEACAGNYHLVDGPTDEGGWQTIININLREQASPP
jgi:LytS/YehU family sensor histidine kinase